MRDDISLDQATECAFQAELICRLMLNSDSDMTSGELAALLSLLERLSASAATWLIGEQGERAMNESSREARK